MTVNRAFNALHRSVMLSVPHPKEAFTPSSDPNALLERRIHHTHVYTLAKTSSTTPPNILNP